MLDIAEIKKKTSVKPVVRGGSNFETQVLYKSFTSKYEFKPSRGYAVFCSIFVLIPSIFIAIGISKLMDSGSLGFLADNWFMTLWTLGFSIGAGFLMRSFLRPNVFDTSINRFYKGFFSNKTADAKNNIKLSRVVALQIIGEVVHDKDSKYNSFELNLVLDDANRVNVVDHGNLKGVIADTETLGDFLNLPIWTAEKSD